MYPDKQLDHYHVVSLHSLLDILSEEEPVVRKLERHEWWDFNTVESGAIKSVVDLREK